MTEHRGQFITFDGIDGAGKTTQIEQLENYLTAQGKTVYVTREPGGEVVAEKIRALLLDKQNTMVAMTEILLMFAARAQHIETVLRPKIACGTWVICSRFTDATLAYQGYASGVDIKKIQAIADIVHGDFNPDISFFLDISATAAEKRRKTRGQADDRFESQSIDFMRSVRQGYLTIAKENPKRCRVVDASLSVEQLFEAIKSQLLPL